ncbi:unnamed protein product, partial [Nesidiocoris tenuis]
MAHRIRHGGQAVIGVIAEGAAMPGGIRHRVGPAQMIIRPAGFTSAGGKSGRSAGLYHRAYG